MRKYGVIFRMAARDQLAYLPSFVFRNLFFVVVLFIFHSLWRVVFGEQPTVAGFSMRQALWYLTFTEAIELSQSRIFRPISNEVKDGTVAYALVRPYSYGVYWLVRGLGESVVKLAPILVVGFLFATLFVGPLPGYVAALPAGLVVMLLGLAQGLLLQTVIGLLAFWFEEVSPFFWILQKLVFVLGGMFFPIDFFPEWIQAFAKLSPFAFSAYWPATTMVAFSAERFFTTLAGQLAYIGLFAAVAVAVYSGAVRRVHAHGG